MVLVTGESSGPVGYPCLSFGGLQSLDLACALVKPKSSSEVSEQDMEPEMGVGQVQYGVVELVNNVLCLLGSLGPAWSLIKFLGPWALVSSPGVEGCLLDKKYFK